MVGFSALVRRHTVNIAHWFGGRGYRSISRLLYSFLAAIASNELDAQYFQVRALIQAGRTGAATDRLLRLVRRFPDFSQGHFEYALLLQQADRDHEALESLERALSLNAGVADWHAAQGFSLLRLDRLAEAEAAFRRALRHDERRSDAWYNLGVLMLRLDRTEEAIESFRAAIALCAEPSTSFQLAHLLEGAGRLEEAEAVVRDGLRHAPFEPILTSVLASVRRGQGHADEAIAILRSAEARDPAHSMVLATLVEVLVEAGHPQEAIMTAERLSSSHPGAAAQAILGWAYLETGRPAFALSTIDTALEMHQNQDDITLEEITGLRASALVSLGKHSEAQEIFSELERQSPQLFVKNPDLRDYAARSRSGNEH